MYKTLLKNVLWGFSDYNQVQIMFLVLEINLFIIYNFGKISTC